MNNWWEALCYGLACITGVSLFGYIIVRVLVGWGMGLEKRKTSE